MDIVHKLMPLTQSLYAETLKIGWALLFVFFLLSLVFAYFRAPQGSFEFLDILKRLVIAMLLLVSFPTITSYIQEISAGMTKAVSGVSGYGAFFEMVKARLDQILESGWKASILFTDDIILSLLSFLSYFLVYISRYVMLALYQFYWALLTVLAPLLIVFYLFRETSKITGGLFRSLIEVCLWPFVWEIMGVMLASLWAGDKSYVEGGYATVIVLNLIIALAMILTPYVVHSLMAQGLSSTGAAIGGLASATIVTAPSKAHAISKTAHMISGSKMATNTKRFVHELHQKQLISRLFQKTPNLKK